MRVTADEEEAMQRALDLARSAGSRAWPNPGVGVAIVHGAAWYEGATEADGGRHAEAVALDAAPRDLAGATVYVTLEPCTAFAGKRTPSCAEALVARGPRRVFVAMEEVDPRVRGRGIEQMRAAGIDVTVGLMEDEARHVLRRYIRRRAAEGHL